MTTETLYYLTKLRLNRLGTGVGLNLEPAVWVSLFNTAQTTWWKKALATRMDSVFREQLSDLLVTDEKIYPSRQDERVYRFPLPTSSYQLTGVYVEATLGTCSRSITAEPTSSQWISSNWANPLQQPDFHWEETYYVPAGSELLVYYRDFRIDSALISYYQRPPDVDLPGYIKLDQTPSRLIDSPLPDELQQEILDELIGLLK